MVRFITEKLLRMNHVKMPCYAHLSFFAVCLWQIICINFQSGIFDMVSRLKAIADCSKYWSVYKTKMPGPEYNIQCQFQSVGDILNFLQDIKSHDLLKIFPNLITFGPILYNLYRLRSETLNLITLCIFCVLLSLIILFQWPNHCIIFALSVFNVLFNIKAFNFHVRYNSPHIAILPWS